jgi:hypothetical protein
MKTLIAIVLLGLAAARPAAAADAPAPGDRHAWCDAQWRALPATDTVRSAGYRSFMNRCLADCPARASGEGDQAYGGRLRDYCEARWTGLLAARETGGQTHDEFIDACLHRCAVAKSGVPLGWILGGVGAAALAAGVAAAGGGSHAPPASP